jgi:hypothetical protein
MESEPEQKDDAKMDWKSEESEIPQEEIIMMTNLESTISSQCTYEKRSADICKYFV